MRRFVRREFIADYVALAYAVVYLAWLLVRTPGTPLTIFIGNYSFWPLGLAVGWAYLRNGRLRQLDRRTRAGWSILGAGAITLWVIGNTWAPLVSYFGAPAYPWWVGALEIFQHVLLIAAILMFPGSPLPERGRRRAAADLAIVVVAGIVLAFHYGARATAGISPASPPAVATAQSILDWAVFVVAAAGVLRKRDATTRVVLGCLLAANTLYLVANYVLSLMPIYHLGDPVDGLWFSAWVLRWIAGRTAWHRYRRGAVIVETAVSPFRRGVFSYLLVAATFALLMAQATFGKPEDFWLFAASATAMAALLLFRQLLELRENRRLFEVQLAQEARFRSLVQNASDVVLVVERDGRVLYASPSAARVLGEPVAGDGCRLADIVHPDDLRRLQDACESTGRAEERIEGRLKTRGGGWREVEVVATDMRHDLAVGGVVLTCRDVTERNELERQLHHAQKLDAVSHLAGGLAHDFNNVLAAIRGYTELLIDDLGDAHESRSDLRHIEQAVDRAAGVTRKLLAFSRKQPVQLTVVDLNAVVRDLEPLLRQLLTDRVEVETTLDPGLWPVTADPGQIEQVLINLLTNARDAMPGGGRVQISTSNRSLAAGMARTGPVNAGDYAALVVADQGTGIPAEVLDRIFEPFFSTKPKDKGAGLGLAMVHGIVTGCGGHVAVEPRDGQGTSFTIFLPRSVEPADADAPKPEASAAVVRGRRVLLVDDELSVRTVVRRMLDRAGYDVVEASSGEEALALAAAGGHQIDLLLTDVVMPGIDGHELIERIRARCGPVPAICISGFTGGASAEKSVEAGVVAVLTKPFTAEALLGAVAAACASSPPRDGREQA
jgi:PAS domain S-box-containing protein